MWNQLAHQILVTESLKQNDYDLCVYYDDLDGDRWIIVLIFVDDLLVIGSSMRSDKFISNITKKLCISSNSELKRYIGVDVDTHPEGGFFLSQTSDILKCVAKHGLSEAKPVATPGDPNFHFDDGIASEGINITDYRSAIGELLYFAICTRPDIMAAVIICAQFQRAPSAKAWTVVKRII